MLDYLTTSALEGIGSFGCVFMELVPGSKYPTRSWDHFEELHYQRGHSRLDLVHDWLKKGSGVGYLLRGGLAAVDCDDQRTVQRVLRFGSTQSIQFPQTLTPSGGRHFLFKLPASIDRSLLKHHVCHPIEGGDVTNWDFKLGSRTMLVAPGTMKYAWDGSELGRYTATPWTDPAWLDPRALSPSLNIYRERTPFVRDPRMKKDRIMGAQTYLRQSAPICQGEGARKVLWEVALHVVAYYDLDPALALNLMAKNKGSHISWNNRCRDDEGNPFPWALSELYKVLENAVDGIPPYGVVQRDRYEEREFARWCFPHFLEVLNLLPPCSGVGFLRSEELYSFFLEITGVRPNGLEFAEFCSEMGNAFKHGAVPGLIQARSSQYRGYRGVSLEMLHEALDRWKALDFMQFCVEDACNF